MSNQSSLNELVPPLPGAIRWKLLAGVLIVAALLPVGAVSGLVRPNVETAGGGGEWNQETGIGSLFISLINRGIVAVTVTSADAEWATLDLAASVRIAPHTETQVRVNYTMTCEEAVRYESSLESDQGARTTLHVQGPGPFSLDYGVDRVVEGLIPTSGMCDN